MECANIFEGISSLRADIPASSPEGPCKAWNGISGLRPSGAFSLNDPYENKFSTGRPTKKHRSFAAMPFFFAEREGFEPPDP